MNDAKKAVMCKHLYSVVDGAINALVLIDPDAVVFLMDQLNKRLDKKFIKRAKQGLNKIDKEMGA